MAWFNPLSHASLTCTPTIITPPPSPFPYPPPASCSTSSSFHPRVFHSQHQQQRTWVFSSASAGGPERNRSHRRRSASRESEKVAVGDDGGRKKKGGKVDTQLVGDSSPYSRVREEGSSSTHQRMPFPSPPAGFILNEEGRVVLMSPPSKRVATIIDPTNGRPLECLIRRVFSSSHGIQCYVMCTLDTPLQILKMEGDGRGVTDLTDRELEEVLPTAAYELAKMHLHLVLSGFCLTARGGFYYMKEDIIDLNTEYGETLSGSLSEGIEVAHFRVEDSDYLIYTPFDPLMFISFKDDFSGDLKIADDDLLGDEAVLNAIDEEKEYQVLVEEEAAINETLQEAASGLQ